MKSSVSVRELVEFILRSGDIDGGFASVKRAQEGTRLHQKFQKRAMEESDYQKEVPLRTEVQKDGILLTVEGRADGIFSEEIPGEIPGEISGEISSERAEGRCFVIDEIKTAAGSMARLTEDLYPLHWAQAECYAHIFAEEKDLPAVDVRLTYIHTESEEIRHFRRTYSRTALRDFFEEVTGRYCVWLKRQAEWEDLRNRTLFEAPFPYPRYREGQRTMAAYVYRAIANREKAFIQAPTGIGKTISAIFPALKAMAEKKTDKIFYLTAKRTTGIAAMAVLARVQDSGARLKIVEITARDTICPLEKRSCNPADCSYAKGHFDRINDAVFTTLCEEDLYTADRIRELADRHRVCPFEFSLDLSTWSDVVVCDYNYAFDPTASLRRFFSDEKTEYVLLVDEAHNLVDRARDMYSAELTREAFLGWIREAKKSGRGAKDPLLKAGQTVAGVLLALQKDMDGADFAELDGPPPELLASLKKWSDQMETYLADGGGRDSGEEMELYFEVLFFLRIADQYDEGYMTYLRREGASLTIRLFCYHPAGALDAVYDRVRSAVLFSATLSPAAYYKEFLGAKKEDAVISLPSPFDTKKFLVMAADQVPLTYRCREASIPAVAALIHETGAARPGNYFVFFPSFQYMGQVLSRYRDLYPEDTVLEQTSGMEEEDRRKMLLTMQDDGERRLCFAVLGGAFSESIDLTGDRVIGAVIVTVGLPQIGYERDRIRDHMETRGGQGFEYAYVYPGIGKVLQAAGRVIRTEEDRGVLLLIDARYRTARYQRLLPPEWYPIRRVDERNIQAVLREFWDRDEPDRQ